MQATDEYHEQLDQAFFKDGYALCNTVLAGGFTQISFNAAFQTFYKNIDAFIANFLSVAESKGTPCECKKGCNYCCHQTVLVSTPELIYLGSFLNKKYMPQALDKLNERIDKKVSLTEGMPMNKLLKFKKACPLLHSTGGFCMAYQARPLACRIYLSQSVKSCIDDLEHPDDNSIFPMLYDLPLRAGRMMNEGFQARLREGRMNSLQVFENTIEGGLKTVLNNFSFDQWLSGEKVFRKIRN
jgi:Fe-S-cluster containining protein